MNPGTRALVTLLLGLGLAWPALAADNPPFLPQDTPSFDAGPACDNRGTHLPLLAETSPTDCCKGHKGVCGCRAGKIVCCDNTVSVNCTCHGDDGWLN